MHMYVNARKQLSMPCAYVFMYLYIIWICVGIHVYVRCYQLQRCENIPHSKIDLLGDHHQIIREL